jgi:hypothetical protein
MLIDNYQQFVGLENLGTANILPGDILVKKIFSETAKTIVERAITAAQRLLKKPEEVKVSNGLFSKKETFRFENRGSSTAEHAAIVINKGLMAEAVGNGVIQATIQSRAHERYIVYRCTSSELRDAALQIAEGLSLARPGSSGGKYSAGGAAISSFRNGVFQKNTLVNRVMTTPTETFLNAVIDYVFGISQQRPNMFCSQFAVTCYEAGSLAAFGKTALGTNPHAMSPMQLENALNYRPDLFKLVGRVEQPLDILHEALSTAVNAYDKNQSRMFRRPSEESLKALAFFVSLLEEQPTDGLFSAVEHYTGFQSRHNYDRALKLDNLSAPLKSNSTFLEILRKHLQPTALFNL